MTGPVTEAPLPLFPGTHHREPVDSRQPAVGLCVGGVDLQGPLSVLHGRQVVAQLGVGRRPIAKVRRIVAVLLDRLQRGRYCVFNGMLKTSQKKGMT